MGWSNRVTYLEERPLQILIDEGYRGRAPIRELSRLAWFAVYTQNDAGNAFWDPDETEILDALEDDLIRLCEVFGKGSAVYLLRIATRGIREYFFYCGEQCDLSSLLPTLKAKYPQYRIEYDETMDQEWKRYTSCLPSESSRRS